MKSATSPIPVGLLNELAALKKNADDSNPLVFPTSGGQADIKLLKALKSDWRDAGLNCGHCPGCLGKRNKCSKAKIKTFRATYLTTMSEFVALPSVQALAGHSDIKTTMRYAYLESCAVLESLREVGRQVAPCARGGSILALNCCSPGSTQLIPAPLSSLALPSRPLGGLAVRYAQFRMLKQFRGGNRAPAPQALAMVMPTGSVSFHPYPGWIGS